MTFLHPILALGAVAAVAIPVLIHLLARRRRKPVRWGAMRFLIEAYRKQRRRMTIEQWLLLATRCLIVLLAGLALSRPMLEAAGALGGGADRTVYILLDNSIASGVRDAEGRTALDRHKAAAREILSALGPGDRAGLITLASPAEAMVAPASTDPAAVASLLDEAQPTDAAADFDAALALLDEAERSQGDAPASREIAAVALSDFLLGSLDASEAPRAVLAPNVRVFASAPATLGDANVQIVSVEPLRSLVLTGESGVDASSEQVRVRLRRTGEGTGEAGVTSVIVRATTGDVGARGAESRASVRWAPGQSEATTTVELASLWQEHDAGLSVAIVATIDTDALPGDNTAARAVLVQPSLRVGVVDRRRFASGAAIADLTPGDWLRIALRPSEGAPIDITQLAPTALEASSLAALDALYLPRPDLLEADAWSRLSDWTRRGGLLLISPPADAPVHLWPDAMERGLGLGWRISREAEELDETRGRLADEQPMSAMLSLVSAELTDLARPVRVYRSLRFEEPPLGATTLLTLADGSPWLVAASPRSGEDDDDTSEGASSRGLVVLLASALSLEWTDLPARPLMVPLVQEIVRQGAGEAETGSTQVAGARVSAPPRTTELIRLTGGASASQQRPITVQPSGVTDAPVREAGLFRAVDARGATRRIVAVNPDAEAARTDAQTREAVLAWFAQASSSQESPALLDMDRPAATLTSAESTPSIAMPLLIAALVLAIAETMMARLFSHASRDEVAPVPAEAAA